MKLLLKNNAFGCTEVTFEKTNALRDDQVFFEKKNNALRFV
jgi:hypothetical protein